jgi:hypothetical protein
MIGVDARALRTDTMSMAKKPLTARTFALILAAHSAVAALTWRDLRARPAEQVRGSKRVWRVASAVNTVGSVAYWLVGRRQGEPAPT